MDEIAHKIAVLDRHCENEGRDPSEIRRTAILGENPLDDLEGFLRRMEDYAALGIEQVWVVPGAEDPVGQVSEICRTVLPRLAEIS